MTFGFLGGIIAKYSARVQKIKKFFTGRLKKLLTNDFQNVIISKLFERAAVKSKSFVKKFFEKLQKTLDKSKEI